MSPRLAAWISTVFYVGKFPVAPGTAGSLVAVGFVWFWQSVLEINLGWTILALALLTALGVIASTKHARALGVEDPGEIVIDEFVGQWIGLILVPAHWTYWLAAFVLFRLFDIWKPLYINKIQSWSDGWGVMADDVLAGLVTLIIIQLAVILI